MKTEKRIFNSAGFTLTELLVSMGLTSMLLLILSTALVSITQTKLGNQATNYVELDANSIALRLSYDIRRASAITLPTSGTPSQSLELVVDGELHTYSLVNDSIILTTPAGSDAITGSEVLVSNLTFEKVGDSGVHTQYELTSVTLKDGQPYSSVQTIVVRREL